MILGVVGFYLLIIALVLSPLAFHWRNIYRVDIVYLVVFMIVYTCYILDGDIMYEFFGFLFKGILSLRWVG